MFYIYLVIVAAVLAMIVWCFITEKDWRMKVCAAMVIVPLLLRVLLIK